MSHTWDWKQSGNSASVSKHDTEWGDYYQGVILTPHGIVSVYSQGHDDDHVGASSYRFICGGRNYHKSESKAHTPRGLAIMAGKFVREIVALPTHAVTLEDE